MLAAMRTARRIDFSAYVLWPGPVERALEAAAARGAEVHVRLEGRLYHPTAAMTRDNAEAIRRLRALHADAALVDCSDADGPPLHVKAGVCDGTAFLDECNWNSGDMVIRDDGKRDAAAIRDAALHRPAASQPGISLDKRDALAQEASLLESSDAKSIDIETEALGFSYVTVAIHNLLASGVRCRVLVSENSVKSSVKAIAALEKEGVEIRAVEKSEKLATAGDAAWIGSADATSPHPDGDRVDWGKTTHDRRIVRALHARFEANWARSKRVAF